MAERKPPNTITARKKWSLKDSSFTQLPSKYYGQNALAKAEPQRRGGFPSLVLVHPAYGEYCIQGGPGSHYRLRDVTLYVVEDGQTMRINWGHAEIFPERKNHRFPLSDVGN